jgi:hypothetical protein
MFHWRPGSARAAYRGKAHNAPSAAGSCDRLPPSRRHKGISGIWTTLNSGKFRRMRNCRTIRKTRLDLNCLVLAIALLSAQSLVLAHAAEHQWGDATATVCMTCASAQISAAPGHAPVPVCRMVISQTSNLPDFEPVDSSRHARKGLPRAPPSTC